MQGRYIIFGLLIVMIAACQRAELQNLKNQVRNQKAQLAQCQLEAHNHQEQFVRCADAQKERDRLRDQLAQMQTSSADAEKRLDTFRGQQKAVEKRFTHFTQLIEKLHSIINSGQLEFSIREGQAILSLSNQVLFDISHAEIKSEGQLALGQVAKALRELSDRRFQVIGHADRMPIHTRQFSSNWELSTARAVGVTKFLMAHGVEASRLIVAGEGEDRSMVSNNSNGIGAKNLRTDIVLLPNQDECSALNSLEK